MASLRPRLLSLCFKSSPVGHISIAFSRCPVSNHVHRRKGAGENKTANKNKIMKKAIWLSLGVAFMVGGAWIGRAAWRAHKNIVTLDVRNAPLRDVVRKIEWLTWERIDLDKRLDGKITLKLKNVPLAEALDRVAEEAGGRAQTLHAVHRSNYALKRLQTALQNGEKIDSAGWTNLAPRSARAGLMGGLKLDDLLKQGQAQALAGGTSIASGPASVKQNGGDLSGGDIEKVIRQQLSAQGLDKVIPEGALADALKQATAGSNGMAVSTSPKVHTMTLQIGPDGKLENSSGGALSPDMQEQISNAMHQAFGGGGSGLSGTNPPGFARGSVIMSPPIVSVKMSRPDGTLEEVEPGILSPERIVIETALDERFTNDLPTHPTRGAAEQAAGRVKGRCTTLYALAKSNLPVGMGRQLKGLTGKALLSGPGDKLLGPAAMADRLALEMRREKADQYEKLTPEQRAQRARDLRALSGSGHTHP